MSAFSRRLFILGALTWAAGCTMLDEMAEMNRQTWRAIRPKATDYRDTINDPDDEWSFVGAEARGDHAMEREPDRFWKKYFQSERARSIERNLGIE